MENAESKRKEKKSESYLIKIGSRSGKSSGDGAGCPTSPGGETRVQGQTRERIDGLELEVAQVREIVPAGAVVVIYRVGAVLGQRRRDQGVPGPVRRCRAARVSA